jgi:hypothetical protein
MGLDIGSCEMVVSYDRVASTSMPTLPKNAPVRLKSVSSILKLCDNGFAILLLQTHGRYAQGERHVGPTGS